MVFSVREWIDLLRNTPNSKILRHKVIKVFIAALFIGLTFLQILGLPGQIKHMQREEGFSLILEIALTLIVGVWMLFGQTALFSLWKIVQEMQKNQFYGVLSLFWMKNLLTIFKLATLIPVLLFLLLISQADDPGFFVLLTVVFLILSTFTLMISLLIDEISINIAS